jgi:Sulfotransferase domain
MPSPDTAVHRDATLISRLTSTHALTRLLGRVLPLKSVRDLEFEYRYRLYQARFGEADSDIHVSTYSKSGTTWAQIILYQLTTAGDMTFDHLFDISPWVWYAAVRETQPAGTPAPRILKSHDDYRRFARGRRGRVVFVLRDGRDVCVSLYHHRRNFKRYTGTFEEHFEHFLHNTEYNWFDHLRPWLLNSSRLPIHYVHFEDLKTDFDTTVRNIAAFCGIDINQEILDRTRRQSSFQSMKEHEMQLGPRNAHFAGKEGSAPYLVKNPDQFIRRGEIGDGRRTLSEAQLAAFQLRFDRSLAGIAQVARYR